MFRPLTSACPRVFGRSLLRDTALLLAGIALCTACGDDSSAASDTSSDGTTSVEPTTTSEVSNTSSGGSSSSAGSGSGSAGGTSSSSGSSDGTTTGPFEDPTAFDTDVAIECNTLYQDCGEGERCTPYANDAGDEWNAVRCVPLDTFSSTLGESCEIEGNIRSGVDNCGPGTLCIDVDLDPEVVVLECVSMCVSGPDDFDTPTCADPELSCVIEGTLAVCLPTETPR
ncbi:MAG: hypothetical protein ACRBN8_44130 [Nannocystales bacterium]